MELFEGILIAFGNTPEVKYPPLDRNSPYALGRSFKLQVL